MSKLIIDITELADWTGKLTGVPRVMNELASRFSQDSEIEFARWNKRHQILESVDYVPQITEPTVEGETLQSASRTEGIKKLIRKSSLASGLFAFIVRALKFVKRRLTPHQKPGRKIEVERSDTLLILADWHGSDPKFIDYILGAKRSGVNMIQVCYDILPVVAPQYSGHSTKTFKAYISAVYPICERIITISESTKRDLLQWLESKNLNQPAVDVIRLGDDFKISSPVKPKVKSLSNVIDNRYVLCVGTVEARKNHALMYYAYKQAAASDINLPPVVIVGRLGWLAGDIYEIMTHDPEVKSKFIFVQDLSDGELAWLYQNCYYTVYNSFYEGWGLPVAESIAYGKPCLCSNTSSVPEIAGKLLTYFSPSAPHELLALMEHMNDEGVRAKAAEILKAYKPTSWQQTYDSVNKLVRSK